MNTKTLRNNKERIERVYIGAKKLDNKVRKYVSILIENTGTPEEAKVVLNDVKDNLDEFSKKLRIEINSRIIALLKEERVDSDAIDRLTSLLMDIKPSAPPKDEIAKLENKVKELESEKNTLEEKADNEKAIIDNLKEQKR